MHLLFLIDADRTTEKRGAIAELCDAIGLVSLFEVYG